MLIYFLFDFLSHYPGDLDAFTNTVDSGLSESRMLMIELRWTIVYLSMGWDILRCVTFVYGVEHLFQ